MFTQLVRPIDKFHGRSPYDIGNELGSIDQRFMASKVALLSPDQDISRLDPDVLTGRLIIVFSSTPSNLLIHGQPIDSRDVLPAIHELRDILVTPLVSSEKIPISEKMFMELVSDSSHDRCSPNDLSSLFRIGEPQLSFAMVYAVIVVPAYARGTEANLVSFWDGNIRGLLKLMIPRGRSFRDTHRRPDFRFVVDGSCVFQGSEEGEPHNPEDPGKTSSNNFIWPHGSAAPYVLGYYCRGSEMTVCSAHCAPNANAKREAASPRHNQGQLGAQKGSDCERSLHDKPSAYSPRHGQSLSVIFSVSELLYNTSLFQ
ncbi:hypothetical protein EDC04DRAFT_2614620 [Pisolithus marmoratus]|nr:hypothetical protein EDC04DRAFT_2614620 [Pisolithus marmoratus]